MPPPQPIQARPPETSSVRIATLRCSPASGLANPIAPVYTSRCVPSRSAITLRAWTFGAPVTLPGGKAARTTPASVVPSRVRAVTSDTRCQRPG
jgi:hypothetical protein